jgi:hypothetical protein
MTGAVPHDASGSCKANPDYPPAYKVSANNRHKRLSFYYCDSTGIEHITKDGICADGNHTPWNYKNLRVSSGILDKNTGDIVFPKGSTGRISWKETMATLIEGTLDAEAKLVTEWSTP